MKMLDFLADFIWPNRCPFCDKIIKWDVSYCYDCITKLSYTLDNNCQKCGHMNCMCRYKNGKRVFPRYDSCTSVAYYYDIERKFILNMKSGRASGNAKIAANMLFDKINIQDIDENCIFTSVPMTKKSLRKRGYNQADLIGKRLAKLCGKYYASNILLKIKETKPQKSLTAAQREKNLIGAFAVNKTVDIKGKTIFLCDDIMTTGSTLNECSKVLKKAGAYAVNCFVFATTGFYEY